MKIVLAGSPQIAVPTFEKIIENFNVVAIVTQPDKPKGRGMKFQETPVAKLGKKYAIKTYKPNKINEIKDDLEKLNFDLFLSFAFGQWVPDEILKMGIFKPVNIHGSLLPKYRGAAPIHYAILNGDKEIGITLMEMIKEMDAGDMFFKASKNISEKTTTGEGFEIISELASKNIVNWLKEIKIGNVTPTKQPSNYTLAPKIDKEFGNISHLNIKEAKRRIKGLNPFPGAFVIKDNKRLKIFNFCNEENNKSIEIKLKDGKLFVNDFQWESKKRVKL